MVERLVQRWLRRLSTSLLIAAIPTLGAQSCVVESKCFEDADCEGSLICSADGACVFQCDTDADCDADFGIEFVCDHPGGPEAEPEPGSKPHHCVRPSACTVCGFPHAQHSCVHGDCQLESCDEGHYDIDGDPSNGCEYGCEPHNEGVEACNEVDDDCDGKIDEDFDLASDIDNCGNCGLVCSVGPHASPVCESGDCVFVCESGWHDNDGDVETGCEAVECIPTTEICNGRDDDCDCPGDSNGDGIVCGPDDEGVDEGFDKTLVTSCGPYCVLCDFAHGTGACIDAECHLAGCDDRYLDADGREANGCECTPTGKEECDSVDNDCDGLVDEDGVCAAELCPADMVPVGTAYCIDRYEASRLDATATAQGTATFQALSQEGVLPWMVNPMTAQHFAEFEAACASAGKRLCMKDEWIASCVGPNEMPYVYGEVFDRETCNCVDTFCDDYCVEQGLATCDTASDCGYAHDSFHVVPTGTFGDCTNEYGTYDINGNVWEVVPSDADSRGYEVRGGAFNCAGASTRVSCGFNASWTELYAGFRCCKDVE